MRKYFLKTSRIAFSHWDNSDIDLAYTLWGDPAVTRYISANGLFSLEQVKDRLNKEINTQKEFQVQYWPLFSLTNKEFIGCCGLRPYDIEKNIYEIGIHLKSSHWGSGYATESVNAVIQYAFDIKKVDNLFAGHNPNNEASKKMLLKLGFKYSHDEFYEPTGLYHSSYFYK
ncbi:MULTISPECIES: GNAT family N-acetyltransferase [Paenibacillus]|uniref:GNAT family N-acetyltransferase n=1 Tax=Paenibacillus TaxID=44249 RepID=UPI002E1C94C2|nr:GNAT family N-acetyltransferase [Paenibacillus macerans]